MNNIRSEVFSWRCCPDTLRSIDFDILTVVATPYLAAPPGESPDQEHEYSCRIRRVPTPSELSPDVHEFGERMTANRAFDRVVLERM